MSGCLFFAMYVLLPFPRKQAGQGTCTSSGMARLYCLLPHLGLSRCIFSADFGPWTMISAIGLAFGLSEVSSWEGSGGFSLL